MQLCSSFSADISLPFISADAEGPKHIELSMSRARYEAIAEPALREAVAVCEDALAAATMRPTDVEAILLVGGATRLPVVSQLVKDLFRQEPMRPARPEEAVAIGAARYARQLQAELYGS
eukprot:6176321-Pleurochrysis_carterae.AAC.6